MVVVTDATVVEVDVGSTGGVVTGRVMFCATTAAAGTAATGAFDLSVELVVVDVGR